MQTTPNLAMVLPSSDNDPFDELVFVTALLRVDAAVGARAHGTRAAPSVTTGTSYAAGTDLIASDVGFTADGTSDYLVVAFGSVWSNSVAGGQNIASLKLDNTDGGIISASTLASAGAGYPFATFALVATPAAGAHLVNVRLWAGSASTLRVEAGPGGAGQYRQMVVAVWKLA